MSSTAGEGSPRPPPSSEAGAPARPVAAPEAPASEGVTSPCVGVCTVESATGLCRGCLRTLDEIAAWSSLSDEGKRAVWAKLAARARSAPAR